MPSYVNPLLSDTKPFAPANNILPSVILRIVAVSDDIGPKTFKSVNPTSVDVVSPRVSDVLPIVISFVNIVDELAVKFNGLKLVFWNCVI